MADKYKKKNPGEKVGNPPDPKDALTQLKEYYPDVAQLLRKEAVDKMGLDARATKLLGKAALDIMARSAAKLGKAQYQNEANYAPQYANLYNGILDQTDPEFRSVRNKLGRQVSGDLDNGYALGDGLSREIEQDVRAGQDARGNWFGPAPTADEAFKKASARLSFYQQRQGAAQAFLAGPSATDKMGEIRGATASTQFFTPNVMNSGYAPSNAALQLSQQQAINQQNQFQNVLAATKQRNDATTDDYNAYLGRYQAINGGGYAAGGGSGGGGWGQAAGMIGGGIASGVAAGAGALIAGGGATAAAGTGLATAASAALSAAACWVARAVYGEEAPQWRRFRVWLLLEAPRSLRRLYLARGAAFAAWLNAGPGMLRLCTLKLLRRAMDAVAA